MIFLFYVVSALGIWFFFFKRRRFDFVSAAFIGSMIYFLPGYYGRVFNPYQVDKLPNDPIFHGTYAVWTIALLSFIIAGFFYNPKSIHFKIPRTSQKLDIVILVLLAVSFIMTLSQSGDVLYNPDKDAVLAGLDRSYILFSTMTQFSFVVFFVQRKYFLWIPAAASMAFIVFVGFRSELANSVIAIMTLFARKHGIREYFKIKFAIPTFFTAIFLFVYKSIYIAVKMGRGDLVQNFFGNGGGVQSSIFKSEPFITQTILNEVLARDFSVKFSYFVHSFLAILPFSNKVLGINNYALGFHFQEYLFPTVRYGMASNIYAHWYAALGVPGIIIFLFLLNFALIAVSKFVENPSRSFMWYAVVLIGAFLAFYINRNDVAYSITSMTRLAYVGLAILFISKVWETFARGGEGPPRT